MYLFSHYSFILFCWGGLALTLWCLHNLKQRDGYAQVDVARIRSALRLLLVFVLLASCAFLNLFLRLTGDPIYQAINNLSCFALFLPPS